MTMLTLHMDDRELAALADDAILFTGEDDALFADIEADAELELIEIMNDADLTPSERLVEMRLAVESRRRFAQAQTSVRWDDDCIPF